MIFKMFYPFNEKFYRCKNKGDFLILQYPKGYFFTRHIRNTSTNGNRSTFEG